jgi:hypothetical protein
MFKRKNSRSTRGRLGASFKVALIVAAIGFVALAFEETRFTAAPANANAAASSVFSGAATAQSPLPATASDIPYYFPSQFAPPSGEVEAQPPTF